MSISKEEVFVSHNGEASVDLRPAEIPVEFQKQMLQGA
jgi:hypothetical protein